MPWQLFGYRSDWSTKLIHGLTSEEAAGFRSRRGPNHDSILVTPHNAPFSTYKEARVHHAARRRGCVAVGGAGARAAIHCLAEWGRSWGLRSIEQIAHAVRAALAEPTYQQKLIDSGFEASPDTTPETFRRRLEADVAFWTPVIEALALKIN